jgi:hypothetical protein
MSFEISIEDRVKYYFGNCSFEDKEPLLDDRIIPDTPFRTDQNFARIDPNYQIDIKRYMSYTDKPFWIQWGDCAAWSNYPVLIKVRDVKKDHNDILPVCRQETLDFFKDNNLPIKNGAGVIANLNSNRHWRTAREIESHDIEWQDKRSNVIWRGASTGIHDHVKRYNRLNFVETYSSSYDVGFHLLCQGVQVKDRSLVKQRLSVPQQLGYKYIVCISGNDRASNTNWVVASNSVPIFAKPRFHSWVCEPWLKPNVHYVEVKEDFSDFPEKIEWCQAHDKECEEIARNGKEFMEQNFTKEKEIKTEIELIKKVVRE